MQHVIISHILLAFEAPNFAKVWNFDELSQFPDALKGHHELIPNLSPQ